MEINYIIEKVLNNDDLFDDGKPNDNIKYIPKFLKKIKNNKINLSSKLKSLLKISPKNIYGTDISIDANGEEKDADQYLRKQGFLI